MKSIPLLGCCRVSDKPHLYDTTLHIFHFRFYHILTLLAGSPAYTQNSSTSSESERDAAGGNDPDAIVLGPSPI